MSRTKQPDYDVKPNYGSIVDKFASLPFKRYMNVISAKINDLKDTLNIPAAFDQYPGNCIPYCIPLLFGPLPMTTARRIPAEFQGPDGAGFEALAPLAQPSKYVIPRNGSLLIDQEFTFEVRSMSAFGFVNWGWTEQPPDFTVPLTDPQGVGDIFDNVLTANGGAMPMDYFGGTFSTMSEPQPDIINISFDVEFYDKLRGRRMHEGKLPADMFQGGRHGHRSTASPLFFAKGTRVEPRLFINEIRPGSVLSDDNTYNAASFKAWVCIVLKGRQHIEIPGDGSHDRLR